MIQLYQAGEVIKKITNRHWSTLSLVLGVLLFPLCISAQGQQTAKVYRIGYLRGGSSFDVARIEAFGQGLRDLGYVEGKTSSLSGDLQTESSIA
jgi:hypothetical protein